jgi:hypothetical protein
LSAWSTETSSTNGCAAARQPAARSGAQEPFERISRDADGTAIVEFKQRSDTDKSVQHTASVRARR